jgi:hypothetical protein
MPKPNEEETVKPEGTETKPDEKPEAASPPEEKKPEEKRPSDGNPEADEAVQNWNVVKNLFRKREDGSLELDPSVIPPAVPADGGGDDDPDAAARAAADAKRRRELDQEVGQRTSEMGSRIAQDLELQRTLEDELKAEPGGDLIIAHARSVMKAVPVEKRNERAWRNAVALARGATEARRREHWINEGRKKGAEEFQKQHQIRIPRPGPAAKSDDELVEELTEAQLREAKRRGMEPKVYAKRLHELKGGR